MKIMSKVQSPKLAYSVKRLAFSPIRSTLHAPRYLLSALRSIAYHLIILFNIFILSSCRGESDLNFTKLRKEMVETQIMARGIKDQRVIKAMLKVPRHEFIPSRYWKNFAGNLEVYADNPVPIGEGQTISQPYIVALMTELLALHGREKVLEIGTGSGYQSAILAELAKEVYTIEIVPTLAQWAKERLRKLGYKKVAVKWADGFLGWPDRAPFDGIIVTCAPDDIPLPLIKQLAEGGRMVIPVGDYPQQTLKVLEKKDGKIKEKNIIEVLFVPMTGDNVEKKEK